MPTLTAASRTDNIQQSVKAFVDAQIGTGMSLTVYFEGMGRTGTLPAQWTEVDTTDLSPQTATMQTGAGRRGSIMQYLIGINCFIHKDAIRAGTFSIFSLSQMANNVQQLLLPPASVAIYDYDTVGNPQVGALIAESVPNIVDVETPSASFVQKNVSATMKYVSEWSTS